MNVTNQPSIKPLLYDALKKCLSPEALQWLQEKAALIMAENNALQLNSTFMLVPRKTGHTVITIDEEDRKHSSGEQNKISFEGWTIDRLTRLWVLLQVDDQDKKMYLQKISMLFKNAEMNELVSLYSALPWLSYPEDWQHQCTEGIRSNIGIVLEAIMYNNPYPSQQLEEAAWNQMVLKAFFTDKDVTQIMGLDERANKNLAIILIDYAKERWAAHRVVNPQLWRLVSKFIDDSNIGIMQLALQRTNQNEKEAAALACYHSQYDPATQLLSNHPDLLLAVQTNQLNWNKLKILP